MYRKGSSASGILASFFAISLWVGLVVYYKFFSHLNALSITAYRVVWSFTFTALVITFTKQWPVVFDIFRNRRQFLLLIICGLLIGTNWLSFILAIVAHKAVEASMGSYLIPMFGILVAIFFFKEPASFLRKTAIGLTLLGVVYMVAAYGSVPWYAFGISISFMFYGAVHKYVTINVLDGFLFEMAVLLVPAMIYLATAPIGFWQEPTHMKAMIMLLGPLSALSLAAFSYGIQRLSFSTVSFIQFIYPTLTFFLGIFYFKEPLGGRLPAFMFIWFGVAVYLLDAILHSVAFRRKLSKLR
jgi:chloramphenicol-sensitive protein RarD